MCEFSFFIVVESGVRVKLEFQDFQVEGGRAKNFVNFSREKRKYSSSSFNECSVESFNLFLSVMAYVVQRLHIDLENSRKWFILIVTV